MQPALLISLRPLGPWRYGPGEDGSSRVDTLFRSDRLYSALTLSMRRLGFLDQWLSATADASRPAVTVSSLFPFQGDTLFAVPPATLWPPPVSLMKSPSPVFLSKLRWESVAFVPLPLIESILMGQPVIADQWIPDPDSGCLLRRDRPNASPFRVVQRARAAVDRLTSASAVLQASSCVEFEPGSGLWSAVCFADQQAAGTWNSRLRSAFKLLADSGFGGSRSSGWGQSEEPVFHDGAWPNILLPRLARSRLGNGDSSSALYWLLSLYSPGKSDAVDWQGGQYRIAVRGGYSETSGQKKKTLRMIEEGSVLEASSVPVGTAVDVAPEGHAHPIYRSGFAVALKLPVIETAEQARPVEEGVEDIAEPEELELPKDAQLEPELRSVEEPIAAAEPEPQSAVESEPHSAVESEPHSAVESEPHSAVESEPHSAVESEPHSAVESEPHSAVESEPHSAVEPEPQAAAEPEPHSAVESEPQSAAETVPHSDVEPDPQAAADREPQLALTPEPQSAEEPEPQAAEEPDSEAAPETEAEPSNEI